MKVLFGGITEVKEMDAGGVYCVKMNVGGMM